MLRSIGAKDPPLRAGRTSWRAGSLVENDPTRHAGDDGSFETIYSAPKLPADNCGGLMPVYAPAPPRKSSYREVVLNAVEQGRFTPTPLTKVGFAIQPSWRFMGSYKWGYK